MSLSLNDEATNLELEENSHAVIIRVKEGCWFDGTSCNRRTLQQIKQCLSQYLEDGKFNFIIDLKYLQLKSDAWIPVIVNAYNITKDNNANVKLVNPSLAVKNVLKITRIDRVFQIYDSINAALENKKFVTHYDNLKVGRNATVEEINSAYATLLFQYESRWNKGDAEAERIRVIIEKAYEVLTDPVRRKEHDIWIAQREHDDLISKEESSEPPAMEGQQMDEAETSGREQDPKKPEVMSLKSAKPSVRRLLHIVLTVLCLVLVSFGFLWFGRYKHIGSTNDFVYVHDRLTGKIFAIIANRTIPVERK